ncbi:MAG: DUF4350 domain-containing protein [Candidatus Bathyarchaeota archaeon]|nr:DUF4350 domain-containing protein [Candidatus Bathyarchaeota archaeon]
MRAKYLLVFGLAVSFTAVVGVTLLYPVFDDLWVENPYWNGLSTVYLRYHPVRVNDLSKVMDYNPVNSTLMIIGPSRHFTEEEKNHIEGYLMRGGSVVLADDFGTGNELLELLGVDVRFNGSVLLDRLMNDGSYQLPLVTDARMAGGSIVLNYPTVLQNVGGLEVVAFSSGFSYLSESIAYPDAGSRFGSFPVLGRLVVGEGELVLLSDSSVFINGMIGKSGNEGLLDGLVRGVLLIDESHSSPSVLSSLRMVYVNVFGLISVAEVRYIFSFAVVYLIFKMDLGAEKTGVVVDEVEEVLKRYPEWDREQLRWLQGQRRKNSGYQ